VQKAATGDYVQTTAMFKIIPDASSSLMPSILFSALTISGVCGGVSLMHIVWGRCLICPCASRIVPEYPWRFQHFHCIPPYMAPLSDVSAF
jgi:hypothetical protein